jgi:hypothetical protein
MAKGKPGTASVLQFELPHRQDAATAPGKFEGERQG